MCSEDVRMILWSEQENMDEIRIKNLEIYAYHGVFEEERRNGQTFFVNVTFFLDTQAAALCDELSKTLDYGAVSYFIRDTLTAGPYQLIETATERLAKALLQKFGIIRELELELRKPEAPVGLPF